MESSSEFQQSSQGEAYRDLRISDLGSQKIKGVSPEKLQKLKDSEARLIESGFEGGLPLYLFQFKGESLRQLEKRLAVERQVLSMIYSHYGIQRPTRTELSARVFENLRQDPEYVARMRQSASQRLKAQREDPEFIRRRNEGVGRWARQPERRAAVSEESKKRWQDPNYRRMMSERMAVITKSRWQDPDVHQRMIVAIKAARATLPFNPETNKKISDSMREVWLNNDYRENQVRSRQKLWEDPEYRARHIVGLRERIASFNRAAWTDPEYRKRQIASRKALWDDPDFRERRLAQIREMVLDPEYRAKHQEGVDRINQNPDYRERRSRVFRELLQDEEFQQKRLSGLLERWSDPEFRNEQSERASQTITRLNQDPEHLKKAAEGIRRLRAEPGSSERFHLPTIQGYRKDIGYFALSAWEANVARVLKYVGREYYPKENFLLEVPAEFKDLFYFDVTQFTVDFIVEDPRGNLVAYDLIAHPYEDPVGYAKADMFAKQHPEVNLHIVDEGMYSRLKNLFADKINTSPELCGWETSNDNLRTNPAKYS